MEKNTSIIVYSQKLAGILMQKGYVLIAMEPNNKSRSDKNVFFFKESPQIIAEIKKYTNKSVSR